MLPNDPPPSRPSPPHHHPPRPRSRKPKNGPKKQPQRGLGVAQLEKIRLEEQSKQQQQQQQEAACLSSLHHAHLSPPSDTRSISDRRQFQQQVCLSHSVPDHTKASSFQIMASPSVACADIHHQHYLQRHLRLQPLAFALPSYSKFNCCGNATNSFVAFPSAALEGPPRQSCTSQQGRAEENERCLSSLSQVQDLYSPRSGMSSSMSMREQSSSQASSLGDKGKRYEIDESAGMTAPHNSPTFLSNILTSQAPGRAGPMQIQEAGRKLQTLWTNSKEPVASFFSSMEPSKNKGIQGAGEAECVQSEGNTVVFTDLCLFDYSLASSTNAQNQQSNREEATVTTTLTAASESLELSSFQKHPSGKSRSLSDQVSSRKRPWILMQEATKNLVDLDGMLSTLVAENPSQFDKRDGPDTDIGLMRMNESPTSSSIHWRTVNASLLPVAITGNHDTPLINRSLSDYDSTPESLPVELFSLQQRDYFTMPSDTPLFTNNRKDCDVTSRMENDEFLKLGLSSSFDRMHTGNQGQQHVSSNIDKTDVVQVHHGHAAEAWEPCLFQGKGNESKGRLRPWMAPRIFSADNQYASSIQLSVGTMYEVQDWRKAEEEQVEEEKNSCCLDLNLKLSL